MAETMKVVELVEGWSFQQSGGDEWLSVKKVPTNVHLDLLDHNKIKDPFLGFNELDCEWVGEKSWTYRVTLPIVAKARSGTKHVLAFDGLDTFATVKLNGKTILTSDNMWIMHRVDVTQDMQQQQQQDEEKVLEVEFASALLEARKIKDAHPEHVWVGFNGDMSRLAVRKAQYHWGWDWGPMLSPCGPWRAVRLETYEARVADLRMSYHVHRNLASVGGVIKASVEGQSAETVFFRANFRGVQVFAATADVDANGVAEVEFHINEPRLWFPRGYGEQALYTVTATVQAKGNELHSLSKRTAFRKAQLIQEPDQMGKSFYFRINGTDVFCAGSNWIPADSFTPRISPDRYRKWLQTMVDGHQVMVRVWGGGNWEEDVFYDLCDELGLLVWHDFMFACGNYPCFPSFLTSIQAEAVGQVQRLRHHPSIVIYAGNNEDYQVQEQSGLTYDYSDKDPQSWLRTNFPARYIYEKVSVKKKKMAALKYAWLMMGEERDRGEDRESEPRVESSGRRMALALTFSQILPEAVAAHAPHVPYHPGSPWGDGKTTSDPRVGDMHQWNVWHGTQEKYQIFDRLGGRFNSEFGMEAFPHTDTIRSYVTDLSQLYPQSAMIDFHNKAAGHERRIATYVVENFRSQTGLTPFVHLTQLGQAEALMFAYRGWRRQWGQQQQRHCGGALVWQLNDCWPGTSWSIIDYFLRKKPAYYAMRRTLAPIAVAVQRAHHDWSVVHARPAKTSDYECWVVSSQPRPVTATVELRYISLATGKDIKPSLMIHDLDIGSNGSTDVLRGTIDHAKEEPHVLAARIWVEGKVVSRDVDWPQPFKYLDFHDRGVSVTMSEHGKMLVTAQKPTKGIVFEEREGVLVDDSAIDVVPGDAQVVTIRGLGSHDEPLAWTFLGASG